MSILSRLAAATVFAGVVAAPLAASAGGGFANPPPAPAKHVYSAMLGIQGLKTIVCPAQAKVMGWVFTNYAGPVQIMIARKGQSVGAPIVIQAVKAANGQYMATYSHTFPVVAPIDAEYRLLVGGGSGVMSNWVPLKASCKVGLPGEIGG